MELVSDASVMELIILCCVRESIDQAVAFSMFASSLNLLRRETVALAVNAGAVESYQAPPATVILQALHFQIPTAALFTVS